MGLCIDLFCDFGFISKTTFKVIFFKVDSFQKMFEIDFVSQKDRTRFLWCLSNIYREKTTLKKTSLKAVFVVQPILSLSPGGLNSHIPDLGSKCLGNVLHSTVVPGFYSSLQLPCSDHIQFKNSIEKNE